MCEYLEVEVIKSSIKSAKGFVSHLFLIIFLLISIPIAVYLALHPQILFPKAYDANSVLERESPQNVQQAVDFLETNLDITEEKILRQELDIAAEEELSTPTDTLEEKFRGSDLEEKIQKLRTVFKIPIIVPDDQVEGYAKMKLQDAGLTVNGSLLDEYSITMSDDCYSPYNLATGTSFPPICSINIEAFSQFGEEIIDILVGDFIDIYKSLIEASDLHKKIKLLVDQSGIVLRSNLDHEKLYNKYRRESLYQGEGNNSWGKAMQEILEQDQSQYTDVSLTEEQFAARQQLEPLLDEYSQKSSRLNKNIQMVVVLNAAPIGKFGQILERFSRPLVKPLVAFFKRTFRPLSKEVELKWAKYIETWADNYRDGKRIPANVNIEELIKEIALKLPKASLIGQWVPEGALLPGDSDDLVLVAHFARSWEARKTMVKNGLWDSRGRDTLVYYKSSAYEQLAQVARAKGAYVDNPVVFAVYRKMIGYANGDGIILGNVHEIGHEGIARGLAIYNPATRTGANAKIFDSIEKRIINLVDGQTLPDGRSTFHANEVGATPVHIPVEFIVNP